MRIPAVYIFRSLFQRKTSTLMTMVSFAFVIVTLMGMLAMVKGIEDTLISSGEPDRLFVINKNSSTEKQSRLENADVVTVGTYEAVKINEQGKPVASNEIVSSTFANSLRESRVHVNVRGVDLEDALKVHDKFKITEGRVFDPASGNEVIVGKSIYHSLGAHVGEFFSMQKHSWKVVGVFSDESSPFESEIWTSRANMDLAFRRDYIASVWLKVKDPSLTKPLVAQMNADPTVSVYAMTEQEYFGRGASTALVLEYLGWFVAVIMSIGAIFSGMNTMFASIANRAKELGALRAIGFQKSSVMAATIIESLIISVSGGLLSCVIAYFLNGISFSTPVPGVGMVIYELKLSENILLIGMMFSVILGLAGGWLPARSATKMDVIGALKS